MYWVFTYSHTQDTSPDFGNRTVSQRPVDYFLEAVSYIGVILSIVFIILTIVSYAANKLVMDVCMCAFVFQSQVYFSHSQETTLI